MATPGLMFDPSIFLQVRTLQAVRTELENSGEQAYVPAGFLRVAESSFVFNPPSPATFFGAEGSPRAAMLFRDWNWTDYLIPYEAPFQPDPDDAVGHALLHLRGPAIDDDVRRILFEEWWYLQHESWIKAATDACGHAFQRAGAAALDVGADAFNKVIDTAEEVPALLKRPGVRTAGKWTLAAGVGIGVGFVLGPLVPASGAALLHIIIPGLAGAGAEELTKKGLHMKKGFLRFDP